MSRISDKFVALQDKHEAALIIFLTAGDPDLDRTVELVLAFEEAGADIIELGVPFSDPLADGPVIQAASQRGLDSGTTPAAILECMRQLRSSSQIPVLLMTCYNPVLQYGLNTFVADARAAEVDGMLITDLPPEEADTWMEINPREDGLDTIFLLAPTTPEGRISLVSQHGSGFVYCISRTGVTGQRDAVPEELSGLVARIKDAASLPVGVGFGISTREHVGTVARDARADGVVVGSAVVDRIGQGQSVEEVAAFVRELKQGTLL